MKHPASLRWCVSTVAAVMIGLLAPAAAPAQNYPTEAIRIIVGYAPGGGTDGPSRLFGAAMSRSLGVPVVIENRPGASGVPAGEYVRRARPDGYTLLWATSASHSVSVVALAPLPYDPVKDFSPITLVSIDPNVIVSNTSFAPESVPALLAYLRAHPRTPVGNAGPATSGRFATELMKPKLGIEITSVSYKSYGPLLTDLIGGQIQLGIMGVAAAVPFLQDHRIKAYVVTSIKRSSILPDVPSLAETASEGFDAVAWSALFAPPKTPAPIIARLNAAMRQAIQEPEVRNWLDKSGLEVPLGSPEQLTAFMQADIEKWVQVAKDNKLTFNSGD